MGFPRRDRRTDAARLAVSTMAWHSAGSDVTKIVPQRGNDAFWPAPQARAPRAPCVSGGTPSPGVSSSSHPRARLRAGYGPSPVGETPRSVVNQRCASQHPRTNRPRRTGTPCAHTRARPLDPLRGRAQNQMTGQTT